MRFFLYMMILTFLPVLLLLIAMLTGIIFQSDYITSVLVLIAILLGIPVTAMMAVLSIRRLNDFNTTGWWVLTSFLPVAGVLLALALFFIPGTPGTNRYGISPDPERNIIKLLCMLAASFLLVALLFWL